jgi:hypothetical protein
VDEQQKGDVHERVDSRSLAFSLRAWAACLRKLGDDSAAARCDERAARVEAEAPMK